MWARVWFMSVMLGGFGGVCLQETCGRIPTCVYSSQMWCRSLVSLLQSQHGGEMRNYSYLLLGGGAMTCWMKMLVLAPAACAVHRIRGGTTRAKLEAHWLRPGGIWCDWHDSARFPCLAAQHR
ncbi:hypothetical protein BDP81DRAFT_119854 [Colletotrichum phormii]|uniref:Secreted protein n=1 Tax=Colletotrichum phormii TaxID=359342 RepID=A0AAI9ZFJ6_9PEZI|nr:uncharacterized protein BDP81DRAFT_119854 [Colletotrichum phormii]KAK1623622.1 hypothetical protein BDP81DRAFT_119854 [Colletotrichum phormii]